MLKLKFVLFPLLILQLLVCPGFSLSADNTCTFHLGGKLFSLLLMKKQKPHYLLTVSENQTIAINFCNAFVPEQCPEIKAAYSFSISRSVSITFDQLANATKEIINYNCTRYSSNSYSYLFSARYRKQGNWGTLQYNQYTEEKQQISPEGKGRKTIYEIQCSDQAEFVPTLLNYNESVIQISGSTKYACPVFEVSSIWSVFHDNWILIGIVLIVMGFQLLFFGRATIQTTIFIASFLIVFAILGAIFTLFVSPYSSTFVIYFSFLILLFVSTLMSYGVTKLVNISLFFVGGILGFIIGMLVNSLFCKIFNVYSVWSLVVFEIIFTIPFGLLTFKFRDQVIIASSSLTGSYLIIRPISWIFGGFPNEFLLYHMIESKQLNSLPWLFFVYLILIIALAIVGSMYQLLKLHRQNPDEQHQVNFIQQSIEAPIDRIKLQVDKLIQKFKSDKQGEDYRRMNELKPRSSRQNSLNQYPIITQEKIQTEGNKKTQSQDSKKQDYF